ncbi:nitrilase-related carbon-nitrogen hydrolase [Hoyosella subflava]|uniref:Nitrilase/cyanide hydratase and apolipoprotein N-acyltransferase n=1 Tax=Hoyosella subflava (strain DSM 45089 / JCM 17490 / NBRC 109087 / DQS3-9A1) TaxID=443218 RepID=F6EQZ8_HOYSD|nr:nitrilase-related carbon-nitrogen hydrolase [Hoyosella subflava]AEF40685.1 Nitrilase/cyanide hydratase and apolipoprotein N-acyltransferase [Hoyosella subflava DQS3-9A1]
MIEPFSVVALSPRTFQVKEREDGVKNVKRINEFMDTAVMVGAWEGAPVRLVVIPEMAIQGMIANTPGNREKEAHFAVTIPGPETDELAKKARQLNTYIAAELYMVKDDDFPDRYFNVAFIIDPAGEVVYKRYKATSDAYEGGMLGNMNPHDVWDEWIAKKGNGNVMDAIFPVARTEIGNIGIAICHEGVYPEVVRGLAMNGAEIIVRPTLIEPAVMNGMWEIQNKAHALFNSAYVVAPNLGPEIRDDGGIQDLFGGQSMIVNPRGQIVAQQNGWTSGDSFVCTTIDIEALRRARVANGLYNQFKDMRTEQYRAIYDQPIYPKNQYLDAPPTEDWLAREEATRARNIQTLIKRGVITPPTGYQTNGFAKESSVIEARSEVSGS